jgi:hypothetical protein
VNVTLAVGLIMALAGSAQAQLPYATTIAKRGDSATGLSPNTIIFQLFGTSYINSAGVLGIRADLSGAGTTASSNLGLWSGRTLQTLVNNAREGNEVATLVGTGVRYSAFDVHHLANDGAVSFITTLTGSGITSANNQSIIVGQPGALTIAASKGSGTVPGVGGTAVFSGFSGLVHGDGNLVGFQSSLTGTGITAANNEAIFLWDPVLGMKLAAYEGAATHIGNGQAVSISSAGFNNSTTGVANFSFDSTGNGRGSSLSDNGTLVLGIEFVDGTQRVLTIRPTTTYCSRADIAQLGGQALPDGQLSADDLVRFLAAFFANEAAIADLATVGGNPTADGSITADDLISFLNAFFLGCV